MKNLYKHKIKIGLVPSLILILIFSLITTFIMFNITPEPTFNFIEVIEKTPSLFWLNYIPIPLCMIILYFIFNNAVLSIIICTFIGILMSVINKYKILMRQDPFIPSDITLINELKAIFETFDEKYIILAIIAFLIFIILIIISVIFFGGKKTDGTVRFTCILSSIAVFMCIHFSIYASYTYYNSFDISGNYYFKVNHYVSKGFIYSFIHDIHTLNVDKPHGYNKTFYTNIENKKISPKKTSEIVTPHIIMVMGEAFSDISENENINFKGYSDPLKNFKSLSNEDNSISSHIIVPNFGGGTSDTEFDVLTGCSTRFVDNPLSSYSFIRKSFDAMPSILDNIGYDSIAIHPGYSWFYNRINVYNYFGFDKTLFLEDSFDPVTQNKGMYINETATIDTIISEFENHIATSDKPLFSFCVTIQNHGPYEEKYLFDGRNFNSDIEMTDQQISILGNYFEGLKDADRELGRLTDYFRESDEPVIVVYFGDHLPGFSNGMEIFELLDYDISLDGTKEEYLNTYKTPFLIWQNDSAKELIDLKQASENINLPEDMTISSNFLGTYLMNLLNFDYLSPLWKFSNGLMEHIPIITEYFYKTYYGVITEELPDYELNYINTFKGWTYYKLFDEE